MNSELFNRLKKIAKKEGHVVVLEENEAFVVMSLDEYEDICYDDGMCDCDCHEEDQEEPIELAEDFEEDLGDSDKELLKKVNEDIAKWRAEQNQKEEIKQEVVENIEMKDEKASNLEEEERYYLEPLE